MPAVIFLHQKDGRIFPSAGIGWIISDESFMATQKTFDVLKLRASYGWVGNDAIAPGQFYLIPTERLYAYYGSNRINGTTVLGIKDPNLQWEVAKEFDIGVEFSMFDKRLTGEIDYYNKLATDALYTIPLPSIGFGSTFLTNAADVLNREELRSPVDGVKRLVNGYAIPLGEM